SGVAVTPDGSRVYVANQGSSSVSVINTATNTVTATVGVGHLPFGVAVTPDGKLIYVVNSSTHNVSVIDTATNTVTTTVAVGSAPVAFGQFIGPAPSPNVCLVDDFNHLYQFVFSTATGDYRFCSSTFTIAGQGKVTLQGSVYTLVHNAPDRKITASIDALQ